MELYVHIPFCVKKCFYCDFVSFAECSDRMAPYIDNLLKEAELRSGFATEPLDTVYIGGGTPSLLSPELVRRLMNGLMKRLPFSENPEISVEANPGTLSRVWLDAAVESGINRLSVGMQAAQDSLLSLLGRIHSMEQVYEAVKLSREAGIKNLNLDLIFGIPTQTQRDWEETLQTALSLSPEHISAYGLIQEEGTPMDKMLKDGVLRLPEPEEEREMYSRLKFYLAEKGFIQYEVSNFALPGQECRHNIGYWRQVPYLGLGISAASMLCVNRPAPSSTRMETQGLSYIRTLNPSGFEDYERMIIGENGLWTTQKISAQESIFETMMLGLRMLSGVSEADFLALHGRSLEDCYGEKLRSLQAKGLADYKDGRWFLTERGMDIQNSVLVELME